MIFIFLALIHLLILTHLQFTAWPEMVSFPYLFTHGFQLYRDFSHPYQPLLTIILLVIYQTFGFRLPALQIFTWFVIIFNSWLIYKTTSKKLLSVIMYTFLQPVFEGNQLWFDLALTPLIILSIYFIQNKRFFWAGIFLSLGLLTKQQAVLLLIPVFFYLFIQKIKLRDLSSFAIGGVLPVVLTYFWLLKVSIFHEYWFWTFTFPIKWLPKFPSYIELPSTKIWMLIAVFVIIQVYQLIKKNSTKSLFLFLLSIAALLMGFPRFSLFHLQPWLAIYVISFANYRPKFLVLPIILLGVMLWKNNLYSWDLPARFWSSSDQKIASEIKALSTDNKQIYLLGPHSLLYVLSDKLPPKPWHDNFIWYMDIPGIQDSLITGWQTNPPTLVLRTPPQKGSKNALGVYQPSLVVDYLNNHYNKNTSLISGNEVWRLAQ